MNEDAPGKIMAQALQELAEKNLEDTDGRWLEALTVRVAPHIRDWDIAQCWLWMDWPDRVRLFPQSTKLDVGIDVVAQRGNGQLIAIQCKARQLDEQGHGSTIGLDEVSHFAAASSNDSWAERWLVTNGDNRLASGAGQLSAMADKPLKLINITHDCRQQQQSDSTDEPGQQPDPQNGQSKTDMQREAVDTAVRLLRSHEVSNSDNGLPKGEARGRIILPCGTGKTRISLQIIEKLTPANQLSIVLCPSIALVAQIRREYLQHKTVDLDILAVCSDETAGYDPKKEGSRNATIDPTVDNSNISADEVKGQVTTDSDEIAQWIKKPVSDGIKVLIGTYQSSHKVSKALLDSGTKARVLIADEAHRTAGLKRKKSGNTYKDEGRLRDFTVCHDSQKFPVTYRVYQTATPRIYDTTQSTGNPDWVVRSMDDEETFGVELYRKSYQEAVINGWLSDYRIIALGINDPEAYETANQLARDTKSKGKSRLTSSGYLRGLALALVMGGATQGDEEADIRSCIAFMNTVDKSKNMAKDLQTRAVKNWVRN